MTMPETQAPYNIARITVRDYLCAKCHGPLIFKHTDENAETRNCRIACANPECKGEGFISKAFIDQRKSEDHANYIEAYANLNQVLGINSGKTAAEHIKELGF